MRGLDRGIYNCKYLGCLTFKAMDMVRDDGVIIYAVPSLYDMVLLSVRDLDSTFHHIYEFLALML